MKKATSTLPETSEVTPSTALVPGEHDSLGGFGLKAVLANGAQPVPASVSLEDALLASIEARLTEQVRGVMNAFTILGNTAIFVRKELPHSADTGYGVTLLIERLAFKLSDAFAQLSKLSLLRDHSLDEFQRFDAHVHELLNELRLHHARFLAIALAKPSLEQVSKGG